MEALDVSVAIGELLTPNIDFATQWGIPCANCAGRGVRPKVPRNRRNGTGLAPTETAAHQPSMGDDRPDSGEAERRQSSGCDRGAPVAVGLVVAHPGIDEAGPTLHHLGEPLQGSRWPTGTGPEGAHTSVPAGRNPSGRHYKEHEAYLYKSAEKNLTADKRKRLYSEVLWQPGEGTRISR